MTTRPGLGRAQTGSGDCSLHIITDPFFAIALEQRRTIFGPPLSPAPRAGAIDMANVTVQLVLLIAQTRLQKV